LHYDEVSRFYPIEFELLFKRYAPKKTREEINSSVHRAMLNHT